MNVVIIEKYIKLILKNKKKVKVSKKNKKLINK